MDSFSFLKMHALGNDFVILDLRQGGDLPDVQTLSAMTDRRYGIGCDQVIPLLPPRTQGADCFMRIFNAPDGSEAEACGNATRCAARIIMEKEQKDTAIIETIVGILPCTHQKDGRITADMGRGEVTHLHLPLPCDPVGVSVGNPHCIIFVKDAEVVDVATLGPHYEHDPLFPARTNVEFVHVIDQNTLRMRVWERSCGITQACGSAACATLIAAVSRGLSPRKACVIMDGGPLDIYWREEDDHVLMTGPASYVFQGVYAPR